MSGNVFDAYARYYDLLYRDKDYSAEAEYIAAQIKARAPNARRILELGCGTGGHAEHLARMGFVVHGVDFSETMLSQAEKRRQMLSPDIAACLSFGFGDVRTVRTGETYDAVISLFHVMSYQTGNQDLRAAFETAAMHLTTGGAFLFDFWYGPAVLLQRPDVRVKRLEDEDIKVTRIAEPVIHFNENVVDVNYSVFIEIKATGHVEEVKEQHRMRYLFLPELELMLEKDRWASASSFAWRKTSAPSESDWAAITCCLKR